VGPTEESNELAPPEFWLPAVAALLVGAIVGWWVALRIARQRFDAQLRRTADEWLQRHAASADLLRTSQLRSQTDLELARHEHQRQLAAAAAEHSAAAARIESHLMASYDEIDRLRAAERAARSGGRDVTDGFAATRPMDDVP
jgi:molecular chaperone GrpE (heat shock protein)